MRFPGVNLLRPSEQIELPPVGSRWESVEIQAAFEVIGLSDEWRAMVEAFQVPHGSGKPKVVLLRLTDFGTRLTRVKVK